MHPHRATIVLGISFLAWALLCRGGTWEPVGQAEAQISISSTNFGDPLPGLNPAQLANFQAGKAEFEEVETTATGLGPTFNEAGCAICHAVPATGGARDLNEIRFGRTRRGIFDPLTALGGSLLQRQAIDPYCQEVIPRQANTIAGRQTTHVFGAGLLEAVPDIELLAIAAAQAALKPDIAGRPHIVLEGSDDAYHVGRFGWKSQHALLVDFAADAYLNEVGITSPLFPTENAPNGDLAKLAACDLVPDPEDPLGANVDDFEVFMRLLAPPPRLPQTLQTTIGFGITVAIGCADCHVPTLVTSQNSVQALSNKTLEPWSDFLLHDVGTGDGIAQGDARRNELRTQPLWGVRVTAPYMHDGRSPTVADAILAHGGQATASRNAFKNLSSAQAQAVLAFLNTL